MITKLKSAKQFIDDHAKWFETFNPFVYDPYKNRPIGREYNLVGADFSGALLTRANLRYCDLQELSFCNTMLYGADLYGAELRGANLSGACLSDANLAQANLLGANIQGAQFYKTFINHTKGAKWISTHNGTNLYKICDLYVTDLFTGTRSDMLAWAYSKYGANNWYETVFATIND